jgi:hypothetical protein
MNKNEPPDEFYKEVRELAAELEQVYKSAEKTFAPMVDSVIQSKCMDIETIERLLDNLLSFACCEPILVLFKKLCRHYYPINPQVVSDYVYAYKEMWVDEENEE